MEPVDFVIVGTPRSGTTLVQRLTCELPGVRVPLETHFLSLFAPALLSRRRFPLDSGALTEELRTFAALATSAPLDLDVDAVVARLGGTCGSLAELFSAVVRTLAGDGTVIGEKTPSHLLWWRPLTRAFPQMRVIAVVRDPRAVVASNLEVPWGMSSPGVTAERWRLDQQQVTAAQHHLGPRCLIVRFEDVVAEPDGVRRTIASHLGISIPATVGATSMPAAPEPWKQRALAPVDPSRATSWEGVLSAPVAASVQRLCRNESLALGYRPGEESSARSRLQLRDHLRRLRFRRHRRATLAQIERWAARPDVVGSAGFGA